MARAKQTDRAEVRRRYRQANRLASEADPNVLADEGDAPPPPSRSRTGQTPTSEAARPSVGSAFRNAYHPANVREDLPLLPQLVLSRAFLGAAALVVAGTVFVAVQPTSPLAGFAFQSFVLPPAIAPIFVVGFFAPRASYLLGLLISVIDVAAYAFLLAVVAPTIGIVETSNVPSLVGTALLIGLPAGVLFASAAAWYKRFLALSSRSRQQQGAGRGRAKAKASGRR